MADAATAAPPLASGSNSTVSSLLGVSRRRSGLALAWRRRLRARARLPPQTSPGKEETVELLPHAKGGVGGLLAAAKASEDLCAMFPFTSNLIGFFGFDS